MTESEIPDGLGIWGLGCCGSLYYGCSKGPWQNPWDPQDRSLEARILTITFRF